ncbi:MAG: hypothetical protein IT168_18430 [Bryobacterales bacterium]|nr:hypothetical protein [Bryobacterales bacterium]
MALRWVVIALALTTGCAKLKRSRAGAPPLIVAPPSSVPEPPPTIQAPPPVEQPKTSQIPTLPPGAQPKVPQPVEPPKPVRTTRRTPAPKAPTTASTQPPGPAAPAEPVPEAPTETPLPQLGAILSQQEQAAYNSAIDAALQRAQTNLSRLDPRRLRGSDRANYQRARSFIMQAQQARETDLAVAKGLADRADILAQDLIRNLR